MKLSRSFVVNLEVFWLREESIEDSTSLPPPDTLAEEITEDLRSAPEQFEEICADLGSDIEGDGQTRP